MKNLKNTNPINHLLKIVMAFFLFILTGPAQSFVPSNLELQSVSDSNKKADEVSVSYVGNSGFLITIGDKKILIDALFKGFAGDYILPEHIQEKLTLAHAPFDDVDLILVTHAHGDHIDPEMVRQHMQNNPKAIFASTQQLVDALNDSTDRCIGFNPTKEKPEHKVINDISIEAFYLPHGPDSRIINIGFLISVNGTTVFQTGDADFDQFTFEEFRSFQLPEKKIDLAFIQHYYLRGDSLNSKFVNEAIGGKYIFPIHYHFTTPAFDSVIIRENFSDAIIFKEELQSWHMPAIKDEFPVLKGDYLGQTPPGDVPIIFAPGIISVDSTVEHGYPTFSPDGNLVFWQSNQRYKEKETEIFLKVMHRVDGQWTEPEISPYGGMPAFSPDGKKLIFISADSEKEKGLYIVTKDGDNWSKPKPMNIITRFPELKYLYGPSITTKGTLYFFAHAEGLGSRNNFGIYRSELINGIYAKPELLPPTINAAEGVINWMPFIAADESYLLFSSDRNGAGQSLFISFRRSDGSWTEAHGLGEVINTKKGERFPYVSPDGKYLFFTRWHGRDNEDIMWVSAKIIDDIKTQIFAEIALKEEMFKAVDAGDLAKVKALIKSNRNLLDIKDQDGSTPLIRACISRRPVGRQVKVAKHLIESGADVNLINNKKSTALLSASVGPGRDYELIKILVSNGADVNLQGQNGITALHWAVRYNDLKTTKFLVENGADINISNNYNGPISVSTISGTVLQAAINYSENNDLVKFLIKNGAKLNIKDSQGNTELHLVTLKGNTDQAKVLIEYGNDLNAKNNYNRTALYYAAKHGYRGVAEFLIASGADKNTIGETNYGKAFQFSESLDEGEAYIWDLNYSHAIKTKNNLLVFTLRGKIGESSESFLANGFLNADELKDQKITMFLRHKGHVKMDGKKFAELAKLTANVNMVTSIKPDFSMMEESEIPEYRLALPNESFSVDGMKVHSIPALAHGMGHLVEVDGLKIFYAGLHISDDKPEHIEKFRKEIDFLKAFGPIDIVMLSTYSHSNYVGTGYEQYLYLLDKLAPKAIYLWGANVPENYVQCAEFLKVSNIPIVYPEISQAAGERHHYKIDNAQK